MSARDEALRRKRAAETERRDKVLAASRARRDATLERNRESRNRARRAREVSLVDLVDRLLDGGVVIHGDITIAVADVDLLYVGLRALVSSVENMEKKTGVKMSAKSPALERSPL
jgi:gas vesicle structural protein